MTPTPNTPEAPQEGLVERRLEHWKGETSLDIAEERNPGTDEFAKGFNGGLSKARDMIYARLSTLLAALTTSPVQSSPGEVELVTWAIERDAIVIGLEEVAACFDNEDSDHANVQAAIDYLRALTPPSSPASADALERMKQVIVSAFDYQSKHDDDFWTTQRIILDLEPGDDPEAIGAWDTYELQGAVDLDLLARAVLASTLPSPASAEVGEGEYTFRYLQRFADLIPGVDLSNALNCAATAYADNLGSEPEEAAEDEAAEWRAAS